MTYLLFLGLHAEQQANHTFTNGTYSGTDNQGDDVYQLSDFWVTVRENMKGLYFEARVMKPELFAVSQVIEGNKSF